MRWISVLFHSIVFAWLLVFGFSVFSQLPPISPANYYEVSIGIIVILMCALGAAICASNIKMDLGW